LQSHDIKANKAEGLSHPTSSNIVDG